MSEQPTPDHDDPLARSVAENRLGDALSDTVPHEQRQMERDLAGEIARDLLAEYPAVRFETQDIPDPIRTGERVRLRRTVITGPWEVDPTQH